jgi:hypothetical protein
VLLKHDPPPCAELSALSCLYPHKNPHTCILRTGKKELRSRGRGGGGGKARQAGTGSTAHTGDRGPGIERHREIPPPARTQRKAKTWNTFLCYLQGSFLYTFTTHTHTLPLSLCGVWVCFYCNNLSAHCSLAQGCSHI